MGGGWLRAGCWLGVDWPAVKDFSHIHQPVASQRLGAKKFEILGTTKPVNIFLFVHGRKRVHGTVTGVEDASINHAASQKTLSGLHEINAT